MQSELRHPPVESHLASLLPDSLAQAVASLGRHGVFFHLLLFCLLFPHFVLQSLNLHLQTLLWPPYSSSLWKRCTGWQLAHLVHPVVHKHRQLHNVIHADKYHPVILTFSPWLALFLSGLCTFFNLFCLPQSLPPLSPLLCYFLPLTSVPITSFLSLTQTNYSLLHPPTSLYFFCTSSFHNFITQSTHLLKKWLFAWLISLLPLSSLACSLTSEPPWLSRTIFPSIFLPEDPKQSIWKPLMLHTMFSFRREQCVIPTLQPDVN